MENLQRPNEVAHDDYAVHLRTSELTIEVLNGLMHVEDFEQAIRDVLALLEQAVHADRLYVLEVGSRHAGDFVEWCGEDVSPRIASLVAAGDASLDAFASELCDREVVFAATVDELGIDESLRANLRDAGVESVFALPLWRNGRKVGLLGADNYRLDGGYDLMRLVRDVGPCLATVIANRELLEELEWSGTHDALTGLLNRRGVDMLSERMLESRPGQPFALGIIDIDDFKKVNDVYGHAVGDEALRSISARMREAFPAGSLLGRNGGDEMVVLLAGDEAGRADELFSRFAQMPISVSCEDQDLRLTISLGYACHPDEASSLADAYKLSDTALYAAKLAGKAQAMRYSHGLDFRYRAQLGFTPRDIAENIPGGIMVHRVGGDGEILFANKSMAELYGCDDLNEFMDHVRGSFRHAVHPDDNRRIYEEIISQAGPDEVGAEFHIDYRIIARDGSVREVAENGAVVSVEGVGMTIYAVLMDYAGHRRFSVQAS